MVKPRICSGDLSPHILSPQADRECSQLWNNHARNGIEYRCSWRVSARTTPQPTITAHLSLYLEASHGTSYDMTTSLPLICPPTRRQSSARSLPRYCVRTQKRESIAPPCVRTRSSRARAQRWNGSSRKRCAQVSGHLRRPRWRAFLRASSRKCWRRLLPTTRWTLAREKKKNKKRA
jgi:hypothetical protein